MKKIKILYLIPEFTPGGAELTLKNIILNLDPKIFDITVCNI
ncbi:MAG: glycosyltransferase, partial [Promethearchaeota archaeon]